MGVGREDRGGGGFGPHVERREGVFSLGDGGGRGETARSVVGGAAATGLGLGRLVDAEEVVLQSVVESALLFEA